jgi:hypothetical protein
MYRRWFYHDMWIPKHGGWVRMWNEKRYESYDDARRSHFSLRDIAAASPGSVTRLFMHDPYTGWVRKG